MATDMQDSKTFRFDLISPEKVIFSGDVAMVLVPGELGEFGVLPNHSNMLSAVRPGPLTIHLLDGSIRKFFVDVGYADINKKLCAVLSERIEKIEDLTKEQIAAELQAAKQWLETIKEAGNESDQILQDIVDAERKSAFLKEK